MIERPFKRIVRGDRQIQSEDFNRAFDQIEENSRAVAGEGSYETSDTETVKQIVEAGPIWIVITSGTTGGAMSWQQVIRLTAVTQQLNPNDIPYIQAGNQRGPWVIGPQSSDLTTFPAYERQGFPVLIGEVVKADYDQTTGGLVFDKEPVVRSLRIPAGVIPQPGNIYPCFVESYTAPFQVADFTPAFIVEPNANQLASGYYVGMLLDGNFESTGMPLFQVRDCCGGGTVSSSTGTVFVTPFPCCPGTELPTAIYALADNIYTAVAYGATTAAWPSGFIPGDLTPLVYNPSTFVWAGINHGYTSSPFNPSAQGLGCPLSMTNAEFIADTDTGVLLNVAVNPPGNQYAGGNLSCAIPAGFLMTKGSPAQPGGIWIQTTDPSAVTSVFWDDCGGIDVNICFTISGTGSDFDATWEVSYRGRGIWRSQSQFLHSDGHPYCWILFRNAGNWNLWLVRVDNYPTTETLVYGATVKCGLPEQMALQNSPFGYSWPGNITLQTCGTLANCPPCALSNVTLFTSPPCQVCITFNSTTGNPTLVGINACPTGSCESNLSGSFTLYQGTGTGTAGACSYSTKDPGILLCIGGNAATGQTPIQMSFRLMMNLTNNNTQILWTLLAYQTHTGIPQGYWTATTAFNTLPTTLTGGNYYNYTNGAVGICNFPTTITLRSGPCPPAGSTPPTTLCLTVSGFANNNAVDCANANSPAGGWVMPGFVNTFPQGPVGTYNSASFTFNGSPTPHWQLVVNYNSNGTVISAQLLLVDTLRNNTTYEYYNVSGSALTFPLTLTKQSDSHNACTGPATVTVGTCAVALTCSLSGSPTSGNTPLQVAFTATATGGQGPYTFKVNLGDGGQVQSTQASPYTFNYTYSAAGTYVPTLSITDAAGTTCTASGPSIVVTVPTPTRTGFGNSSAGPATGINWTPTVTIPANSLVLIGVAMGGSNTSQACTLNGTAMTLDDSVTTSANIYAFSLKVTSTTVNPTFAFTSSGSNQTILIIGVYVQNLTSNVRDVKAHNNGTSSSPASGATGTSTQANEYVQGWIAVIGSSTFGSAQNSFTSGGQDVFMGTTLGLRDMYRIVSATGTFNAADSQVQTTWSADCISYK